MDLKTRKIDFIQAFFQLENEEAIARFEKLLKEEKELLYDRDFKPMTIEELQQRIKAAMEDSKNNRLTESKQLLAEIETWN